MNAKRGSKTPTNIQGRDKHQAERGKPNVEFLVGKTAPFFFFVSGAFGAGTPHRPRTLRK
jgi:hypothetical protein